MNSDLKAHLLGAAAGVCVAVALMALFTAARWMFGPKSALVLFFVIMLGWFGFVVGPRMYDDFSEMFKR